MSSSSQSLSTILTKKNLASKRVLRVAVDVLVIALFKLTSLQILDDPVHVVDVDDLESLL